MLGGRLQLPDRAGLEGRFDPCPRARHRCERLREDDLLGCLPDAGEFLEQTWLDRRVGRFPVEHRLVHPAPVQVGGRWPGGMDRLLRALLVFPQVSQKLSTFIASENSADLKILQDLIESGKLTPAINRTYPLSQTPAAIRHVQEGRARGKVVITI